VPAVRYDTPIVPVPEPIAPSPAAQRTPSPGLLSPDIAALIDDVSFQATQLDDTSIVIFDAEEAHSRRNKRHRVIGDDNVPDDATQAAVETANAFFLDSQ